MICKLLEDNQYGTREIADIVGTTFAIVSNIKHKKSWTHISKNFNIENHHIRSKPINLNVRRKCIRMNEESVIMICDYLQNTSKSLIDISAETGINIYKINSILYKNAWVNISNNYDFSKRYERKK